MNLAALHKYPKIVDFYLDYCHIRGAAQLIRMLEEKTEAVICEEIKYCDISSSAKIDEHALWRQGKFYIKEECCGFFFTTDFSFSLPMIDLPNKISNCCIDGFRFVLLRSTGENIYYRKTS